MKTMTLMPETAQPGSEIVPDPDWWRGGGDLSDLSALLQDTNGDGIGDLAGIIRAARLYRLARRRRDLDLAVLHLADEGFRL
jgi:hypothetical protein